MKKNKFWNLSPRCALTIILATLMIVTTLQVASAQIAPPPTSSEVAAFNEILKPIWTAYNLIRSIATAIASIFLLYAGITYIASGNDITKRDTAKHMITYVIVGLVVIWVAPVVVQLFTS